MKRSSADNTANRPATMEPSLTAPPSRFNPRQQQRKRQQKQQQHVQSTKLCEIELPRHEFPFPVKLHQLLSMSTNDIQHIIRWQRGNTGRSFTIENEAAFEELVLPKLYNTIKMNMKTFKRLLDLYGFQRVKGGDFHGDYFHPFFMQHRLQLAHRLQKTTDGKPATPYPSNATTRDIQGIVASRLQGKSFASRLHYLLSHGVYDLGLERIMRWQPCGLAFVIYSQEHFEMLGLADLLGMRGYSSFRANLKLSKFQLVTRTPNDVSFDGDSMVEESYCHPYFAREEPELCHLIASRNPQHLQNAIFLRNSSLNSESLMSQMTKSLVLDRKKRGYFVPYSKVAAAVQSNHVDLTLDEENPDELPRKEHPFVRPSFPQQQQRPRQQSDDSCDTTTFESLRKESSRKRARVGSTMEKNYFPFKLHSVLTVIEKFGLHHVLSWAKHGRCFKIDDRDAFDEVILPLFNHSEFASFRAQLKAYGFERIPGNGADKGCYFHPCFVRCKPELCATITRRPKNIHGIKRGRPRGIKNVEPDFYKMKFLPEQKVQTARLPAGKNMTIILETELAHILPPPVLTRELTFAESLRLGMNAANETKTRPHHSTTPNEFFLEGSHDKSLSLPVKLHRLLNYSQENRIDNCICWNDDGCSFNTLNSYAFQEEFLLLMKHWLHLPTFGKFEQELELYGFERRQSGSNVQTWYHQMFHKALPYLCGYIKKVEPTVTTTVASTCSDEKTIAESSAAMTLTGMDGQC